MRYSISRLKEKWIAAYGEQGALQELRHYYRVQKQRRRQKWRIKRLLRRARYAKRGKTRLLLAAQRYATRLRRRQARKSRKTYKFLAKYIPVDAISFARAHGLDPVSYYKHVLRERKGGFQTYDGKLAPAYHPSLIPGHPGGGLGGIVANTVGVLGTVAAVAGGVGEVVGAGVAAAEAVNGVMNIARQPGARRAMDLMMGAV